MRKTRKYDKEFRINAVKHYESSEKNITEVAEALGVPSSTLAGCCGGI